MACAGSRLFGPAPPQSSCTDVLCGQNGRPSLKRLWRRRWTHPIEECKIREAGVTTRGYRWPRVRDAGVHYGRQPLTLTSEGRKQLEADKPPTTSHPQGAAEAVPQLSRQFLTRSIVVRQTPPRKEQRWKGIAQLDAATCSIRLPDQPALQIELRVRELEAKLCGQTLLG